MSASCIYCVDGAKCKKGRMVAFGGCNQSCPDYEASVSQKIVTVSHAESLTSVETTSYAKNESRSHDRLIKGLLRNARYTGFLLSRVLKELKSVTLDEFCLYTGADVDTGESLMGQATELGSTNTKDVRLDLVFEYDSESKLLLRINEEPQTSRQSYNEKDPKSYSLIARAFYYAALTMVTELQSEEQYHAIRKVYSVWICFDRPIVNLHEPIISYSVRPDDDYFYEDHTPLTKPKKKFDDGDLIGVVVISVKDIEKIVKTQENHSKYDLKLLTDLYNLLSNDVSFVERNKFYHDNSIIKKGMEAGNTMTMIEELNMELNQERERAAQERERAAQERERAAKAEELVTKTVIDCGNLIGWSKPTVITEISKRLGVSQQKATDLYNTYS